MAVHCEGFLVAVRKKEPVNMAKKKLAALDAKVLNSISDELDIAGDRAAAVAGGQPKKKKYAEDLTDAMAVTVANALRKDFPGILPGEDGKGKESPARTVKGFKRLDVNYSTPKLGMALGISLKSVNFPESGGGYAKNVTARDN